MISLCRCADYALMVTLYNSGGVCLFSWIMRPQAFTTQQKWSSHLAMWRAYLQEFIKFIQYKAGKENQVADTLRCCKHLSTSMSIIVPRFEEIWNE